MLATANTEKSLREVLKNAGEWPGRVEISNDEIPGSKHSIYGYKLLQALKGEPSSSVFSTDFNFCVRSSLLQGSLW